MDARIEYTMLGIGDLVAIDNGKGGLVVITLAQLRAITEATPAVRESLRAKWAAEADNPTKETP